MSKMQSIYVEKVTLNLQKDLEILSTDTSPIIGENKSNETRDPDVV